MKKNLFLTTFVIFLSLVILTGCLPSKTTTDQSSTKKDSQPTSEKETIPTNWETYENQSQQFSFQYSPSWQLNVISDQIKFFSASLKKEDFTQGKIVVYQEEMTPSYQISIMVKDNAKGLSAKETYLNNFSASSREKAAETLKETIVAGLAAIEYVEGVGGGSGPGTAISVNTNNKIYTFTYMATATKETHEKFLAEFEQILSTVKF